MSPRERVMALRLMEKLSPYPEFAEKIGVEVSVQKYDVKNQETKPK